MTEKEVFLRYPDTSIKSSSEGDKLYNTEKDMTFTQESFSWFDDENKKSLKAFLLLLSKDLPQDSSFLLRLARHVR